MNRLIEKTVFCGFVTCCRRAGAPTSRWSSLVKPTTDGVVRPPSAFAITAGSPPSSTAMHEFVVPRSIPSVFATSLRLLHLVLRKSKSICSRCWMSAVDPDQRTARDHQRGPDGEPRPHPLAAPEEQRREGDAPQRLGRDERRDDRHAAA